MKKRQLYLATLLMLCMAWAFATNMPQPALTIMAVPKHLEYQKAEKHHDEAQMKFFINQFDYQFSNQNEFFIKEINAATKPEALYEIKLFNHRDGDIHSVTVRLLPFFDYKSRSNYFSQAGSISKPNMITLLQINFF